MANKNENLSAAKNAKKDEFYTQLVDIENELRHYKEHFKDKIVFCNCDDPYESNFVTQLRIISQLYILWNSSLTIIV